MTGAGPPAPKPRPAVLWVTPQAPDPRVGGGGIRQAHLLRALAEVADVDLVLAGPEPLTDKAVQGACRTSSMHVVADDLGRGRLGHRAALLRSALGPEGPWEVFVARHAARRVSADLGRLSATTTYDAVVVQHAAFLRLLPARRASRWVAEIHRLASRDMAQAMAITTSPRHRWLFSREVHRARRLERWAASAYDLTIAVSDEDLAELGGRGVVVPNGVDTARFPPSAIPSRPVVVMTGALATRPNSTGVHWLCQEVLPLVRRAVPDVEVQLVGAKPSPDIIALGQLPGVSVHADVPETLPFLSGARVAIVPLLLGSGTRLKALEAFAAGRPVVGTTVGLEGLGIRDGVDALVADTPEAFAGSLVRVLTQDALAAKLAAGGRLVAERHDWKRVAKSYVEAVLGEPTRPAGPVSAARR
jgi:glycosyltransferase involved in cell wall biosynthesis